MTLFIETKKIINELEQSISEAGNQFAVFTNLIKRLPTENIKESFIELEKICNDNRNYLEGHFHIDHSHGYCHSFNETEEGQPVTFNDFTYLKPTNKCRQHNNSKLTSYILPDYPVTALYILTKEFNDVEDHDMNGQIFGKDFIFELKDKQVPLELIKLQLERLSRKIPFISWNEYLNTCPSSCPWKK